MLLSFVFLTLGLTYPWNIIQTSFFQEMRRGDYYIKTVILVNSQDTFCCIQFHALWLGTWDKQDRESSEDAIAPQKSLGPVNRFLTGLKGHKDRSLLYRLEWY